MPLARAVYAPAGDHAHLSIAVLAEGSLADVLAAAEAQPSEVRPDLYIYINEDDVIAMPLAEARERLLGG